MFPNVRLMMVAISASILAVICAMTLFMGMFAAFSFTHESFSGLAAAKPPLQIAFADEIATPVTDGRPAPFGVRFRLDAPRIPDGPVIVPVPATEDHAPAPETQPAEPVTNPAANAQADSPPNSPSLAVPSHDDTRSPQPPLQEAPAGEPVHAATHADDKASEAKSDDSASDDTTAAIIPPAEPTAPAEPAAAERTAAPSPPPRVAPQIRIVSREADNPASVATSPAPTFAHKGLKRRKLAAHLRQSHHFRRPRIVRQPAAVQSYGQATGFVQPNAFGQPVVSSYLTGAYGQQNGFIQPGFGLTPTAIKPRPAKSRRAVGSSSGHAASSSGSTTSQ